MAKNGSKKKGDAFDAFSTKKAPAKKSASKKIAATDITNEIKAAVDEIVNNKAKIKQLKADQEQSELLIIEHVYPQQETHAREGNYSKSFTVEGNEGSITYTTQDKFSIPKEDDVQEEIKRLLGKQFDTFFQMFRTVTFTEEAMQNKDLINDMVAVAVEHGLEVPEVFTIVDELKAIKGMDEKQFDIPKAKLANLRTLIKQYKATLK